MSGIPRVARIPQFDGDVAVWLVDKLAWAAHDALPAFGLRAEPADPTIESIDEPFEWRIIGPPWAAGLAMTKDGPAREIGQLLMSTLRNAEKVIFTISGRRPIALAGTSVMAAINATPDSFSDGGELLDPSRAAAAAADAWSAGAAIIDVGGESTRPGAAPVAIAEEIRRVVPVIVKIKQQIPDCYISIDTSRAAVAREAAAAGASMINDISGLRFDAELGRAAAELQLPIVLGHIRGAPATMLQMETYKNVLAEVHGELFAAVARAREAGVRGDAILVDPGLGFAKSAEDNWSILRRLLEIKSLGFPVVVGPSRKRFLGELVDDLHPGGSPRDRDDATLAVAGIAAMRGAAVCRVHDARRALDAVRVGMKFYSNLY